MRLMRKTFFNIILGIFLGGSSSASFSSPDIQDAPEKSSGATQERWLLYEIWKDGVLKGYIFGGAHVPMGNKRLPKKIFDALSASKQLVFEFNFFDKTELNQAQNLLTKNNDGKTLKDTLLPETMARLNEILDHFKINENGRVIFNSLSPFMAVSSLAIPCTKDSFVGKSSERELFEYAVEQKLAIGNGLEDANAQLGYIQNISKQEWHAYVIAYADWITKKDCIETYRNSSQMIANEIFLGNADNVYKEYMRFYTDDVPVRWFQEKFFLDVRNKPMAEKISGFFQRNEIFFFSVGPVHLGGEKGLLKLLTVSGYEIKQK